MRRSQSPTSVNKRQTFAVAVILFGILSLGLSFLGFGQPARVANWTTEEALAYQAASSNLHRLSHEYAQKASTDEAQKVRAELQEAQQKYQNLRADLDSAMARPKRLAWFARLGGVLLLAAGIAGFFYRAA